MARKKKRSSHVEERKDIVSVPVKRHGDCNKGHPHIIFDSIDDSYVSVGTTSNKRKGQKSKTPNYQCEMDILGNGLPTYLRRQATIDKKKNYYGFQVGHMTNKDYARALAYANKAKQKYLKKKK